MPKKIRAKCTICNGEGLERCPTCNGTGHVTPKILKMLEQYNTADTKCPMCMGEKVVMCHKCFGSGKPPKAN